MKTKESKRDKRPVRAAVIVKGRKEKEIRRREREYVKRRAEVGSYRIHILLCVQKNRQLLPN